MLDKQIMSSYQYKSHYKSSKCSTDFGSDGLIVYALSLRFNEPDLDYINANFITDGSNDKGIDAVYVNEEYKTGVIVQSYIAENEEKTEAKASKAFDLNGAVTWALAEDENNLPDRIKSHVLSLRENILNNEIDKLELWYVHNLDESLNVNAEMDASLKTLHSILKTYYEDNEIETSSYEVGNKYLNDLYLGMTISIKVHDEVKLDISRGGFKISSNKWDSYVTAIKLKELHQLYQEHGDDLFSVNVRGYLGRKNDSRNINNNIRTSSVEDSDNFWVYNNGITCLTHDFNKKDDILILKGLSIVNGAQTTGSIGKIEEFESTGYVPIRFIKCQEKKIIDDIRKYNNSQNSLIPADFRSNDQIQKIILDEFAKIEGANYNGKRGDVEDLIKPDPYLISADLAAQSLAAFHGEANIAYNQRAKIWRNDVLYQQFFKKDTTAKHIIFTSSLIGAILDKRKVLKKIGEDIGPDDKESLEFLSKRGGFILYATAIGKCIEIITNSVIPNKYVISFGDISYEEAKNNWGIIIERTLPSTKTLVPGLVDSTLRSDRIDKPIEDFKIILETIKTMNKTMFNEFNEKIIND